MVRDAFCFGKMLLTMTRRAVSKGAPYLFSSKNFRTSSGSIPFKIS